MYVIDLFYDILTAQENYLDTFSDIVQHKDV